MSGAPRAGGRASQARVLGHLRVAARKGDRVALTLALDEMRTLAYTPRYWLRYLTLLRNPLARIVDLLVIKQGEKIARQKGWTRESGRPARRTARPAKAALRHAGGTTTRARGRRRAPVASQPSLFPGL
jgi:hypothetical protein